METHSINKANLKNLLLLICFSLIFCSAFSQSTFDKFLSFACNDLSAKMLQKNKKKIVVLFIKENNKTEINKLDANKSNTVAGKYIADILSINLINDPGNFEVFDRDNLSGIIEAKNLIDEGYIDVENTKKLGKILAVEAIIIGNYTILNDSIKLTIKALDVNSGSAIAATLKNLPIDADAASLLGIRLVNSNSAGNKGFNNSLKSNEDYNNPNSVNKECEFNNTGDYCFTNEMDYSITLDYSKPDGREYGFETYIGSITIEPGQTSCLYELKSGIYSYSYGHPTKRVNNGYGIQMGYKAAGGTSPMVIKGQLKVEKCTSKTFVIK